jgi:hypothetical protein
MRTDPHEMIAPRAERAAVVGLFFLAAAYFALGCTLTLEWTDEGQIVYPSWRVAQGAVPYRDFGHFYGPSLFFWNGALFRLFGSDLVVIRTSVGLLKAAVVVLVYLLGRRVAPPGFALIGAVLLIAVWGLPWWVFNAPYANHYAMALSLCGLLVFLRLHRRVVLACALAGLCFGAAATFKQTNGLFFFAAFAVFLLCEPYLTGAVEQSPSPPTRRRVGAVRSIRVATPLAALAMFVAYTAPHADLWTFAVLLAPVGTTLVLLARRAWRRPSAGDPFRALIGLAAAACGAALPFAAYVVFYASQGRLRALIFNISELPRLLGWFDPLPTPPLRVLIIVATLLLAYGALGLWRAARRTADGTRGMAALIAAGASLLGVVLLIANVSADRWYSDAFRVIFVVPFVIVAISLVWLTRPTTAFWNPLPDAGGERRRAVALFHLTAVTSLLYLYPAGDFWHLAMIWPAFLPLLAYQLRCAHAVEQRDRGAAWVSRILLTVVVLGLAGPPVFALASTRWTRSDEALTFERASGVSGSPPKFGDAARLVRTLDELDPQRGPLLIIANEQMLYFLSGRVSALDADEFSLYLIEAGLIDAAAGHSLVPEGRIIERLRTMRPRVVDVADSEMSERFRAAYPAVAELLRRSYELEATVGDYRVWRSKEPAAAAGRGG